MLTLDPLPKIITFDCYGTLVQWHRAMREAIGAVLAGRARQGDAAEQAAQVADRLREVATAQQLAEFRDYKTVLGSSLHQALADLGYATGPDDQETLLSGLRRIEPHPDTRAALERLRGRYRLAIISNTDDDLIAATVEAIGVPIDFVITAQQAKAYKPGHQLFLHAHAAMGVTKEEVVHVGMGQYTDMKVCHELGIRSVWINRAGEPANPDWPAHAMLSDLRGLPELLLAP